MDGWLSVANPARSPLPGLPHTEAAMSSQRTVLKAVLSSQELSKFLEANASPTQIANLLEEGFSELENPSYAAYEQAFRMFLDQEPKIALLHDTLAGLDDFGAITDAARSAGFVLGFEYCRRLFTGGAR